MSSEQATPADVEIAVTQRAEDPPRRVDEWAVVEQAEDLGLTLEDAYGTVDRLSARAYKTEAEISDYEEAYWALKRTMRAVELLAHLDGHERVDFGRSYGELTEEELERV